MINNMSSSRQPLNILVILTPFLALTCGNPKPTSTDCNFDNLTEAISKDDLEVFKNCARNEFDIYQTNEKNESLLAIARKEGRTDIVKWLKEYQYSAWKNLPDRFNTNEIIKAIEFDNESIVKEFLENGFEVNEVVDNDMFPSVYAIFNDSHSVLKLFLKAGADVNAVFDFRPLVAMTSMFEQNEILETLIEYGADVNDADGSYVTPLMFAAMDGNEEIINILLKNGADLSMKDAKGATALDYAVNNDHKHVLDLLR